MDQPVAIITGAGRGIGRAAAVELARRGYRLSLLSRTIDELQQTAKLAAPAEALPFAADISRYTDVLAAVATTISRFGRIDAIVHCAGLAPVVSIAEMAVEDWHAVIDTNLSAAFYLCKAAWRIFQRQNSGVVVNVSSMAARDPFPGFGAYGAAKAGINILGLSAAREGQKIGVRVHTIAPGAVETAMFRKIMTPQQYSRDLTLKPEDVATIIAQCVTGELRYTSGEVIYVHKSA
jgi:NAD(P)-dependent dehydrogenase (short-subunit alcohol dehydrogenase family)